MVKLENISKPKIVDLLRVCDRNNWVFPRIRYASVRSKPTLLADIRSHFEEIQGERSLELVPRNRCVRCPRIQYELEKKSFLFDGAPIDLPKAAKVQFRIVKGPVIVNFGTWTAKEAQPSNCAKPVDPFQKPRTRSLSDSSDQNPPSDCSTRTPSSIPCDLQSLGTRSRADSQETSSLSY